MNEKIKEIFDRSNEESIADWKKGIRYETSYEKFAELIVKECIGVVEGGRFLHDQAPTALFAKECSGAIKRHFGVEE